MKVCVCGSREFNDYSIVEKELLSFFNKIIEHWEDTVKIVSGCARGADNLGEEFAKKHNLQCHKFPANWKKYGKRAGFIRNQEMAKFSDIIIAFWDGKSRGTKHMIDTCKKFGKQVYVIEVI